ncbi:MAG: FHA domain-containing protein [Clostridia bacterium]|nr:FHA domain-containing protein [Clostridia bacterium]
MTPVKCQTCNLFYDSEKYTQCPHCAKGGPLPKPSYTRTEQHSRHTQTDNMPQKTETEEKSSKKRSKFLFLFKNKKDEKTAEPIKNTIPAKDELKNKTSDDSPKIKKENTVNSELPVTEFVKTPPVEINKKQSPEAQQPLSISEAVKKAESVPVTADQKTVAHYNFSNSIEPVAGWLVCLKGEYKGESFNIKTGRSSIGRSLTMDIALAKEKSVSRERHASVIFEPNKRQFYIQSGDSSGLTYVNDNLVLTVQELKEKDVITLGESKFMFINLAGEKFSWDDYA